LDDDREKRRPVIVVEPQIWVESLENTATVVVACSATAGRREADAVALPNRSNQPQCTTGLVKPCCAIPRWFLLVSHETILKSERSGTLGGKKLQQVISNYLIRRDS
jgi:hypothetical protein